MPGLASQFSGISGPAPLTFLVSKTRRIASGRMNTILHSVRAATLLSPLLVYSWATASEMTGGSSRHPILPAPAAFNSTASHGEPLRLTLRVEGQAEA